MKKLLFMSLLLITQTTKTMQLPSGNGQEVEIKFKDHILMPDGTHMRMVYEPLLKQMFFSTFNSDLSLNRWNSLPTAEFNIEIERICGIASYKHYMLFAAIGTLLSERDTVIIGGRSNINNFGTICATAQQANLTHCDVSSVVFAKTKLLANGVGLDKAAEKYFATKIHFSENQRKQILPDLE